MLLSSEGQEMSENIQSASELASRGGKARAQKLTVEERSEQARHAVESRWHKDLPTATHGSPDHPLRIGDIEIPCYVLADGRRVLHQRGMVDALGMSRGSSGGTGGDRLAKFVAGDRLKPFLRSHLVEVTESPIKFKTTVGQLAYGYEATVLADICEAVLAAREAGALQHQQMHIAKQCEILIRGFARVGIIALVDEATGFQYDRPRRELEEQLKKFLSESLRRWVRTFPADYFKHLCRLRGVELRPDMKLPQYFGCLTNNLVYRRLAPGLLKRLKERRVERGNPSNKLPSWLSADVGFPEVLVHLGTVVGLMKLHTNYEPFEKQLDEIAPIYPEAPGLFDDPKDWEERRDD
jgi:hypothetical protein